MIHYDNHNDDGLFVLFIPAELFPGGSRHLHNIFEPLTRVLSTVDGTHKINVSMLSVKTDVDPSLPTDGAKFPEKKKIMTKHGTFHY